MTRNCRSANKAESFGSRLGGSGYVLRDGLEKEARGDRLGSERRSELAARIA